MPFSKPRRGHTFFMILFFASLGLAGEVIFTAFTSVLNKAPLCDKPVWALAGKSYVWMIFIYGLIPIFGHYGYDRIKQFHVATRLIVYVLIIYLVEFLSGYLLQKLTGSCPWQYTSGLHIMGLIRLD